MPSLIIGNSRTEEMVGDLAALTLPERQAGGCSALRSLWFAETGDVLVLPYPPSAGYLAYVTGLTGTDPDSLALLCPPPGVLGLELLTPDRIAAPQFRAEVREMVRQRGVDRVLAVFKDVPVTRFADAIGLTVPGHAFSAQGGDALLNSKATFRALAAAAGAPIAPGVVTTRRFEATEMVDGLLAAGHSVMVKQEFRGGGAGNEILSPKPGVRVAGAPRAVVLPDPAAVEDYFAGRWDWLTDGGRHRLVVEQYLVDCDTVYAEYLLDDDGPSLSGTGALLMDPVAVGQIIPAPVLTPATRGALVEAGLRVCRSAHAMGYRGYLSTDSLLTPDGRIVITETNGRLSGSTHLHAVVEARVLGPAHRDRRVLLERWGIPAPSFDAARDRLDATGLAYRPDTATGVLLTSTLLPDSTITCCVIAEDLPAALEVQARLATLFTGPAVDRRPVEPSRGVGTRG